MRLNVNTLGLVEQALTNLSLGFGLALFNVILCYFMSFMPRFMSVLEWKRPGGSWARLLIIAYTLALIFQVVTSPFFRSMLVTVYSELAWSPYQAFWNVAGIILMDLIVKGWKLTQWGVKRGGEQLQELKVHAVDTIDDLGAHIPLSPTSQADAQERRQLQEEAALQEQAARKQRMDERLKDY